MTTDEKSGIAPQHATVAELLRHALALPELGHGLTHLAYDLGKADPAFDDYVLRVPDSVNFHDTLRHTTSLTPPERLITGPRIGQSLLEAKDIEILRREPGAALRAWQNRFYDSARDDNALQQATQILDMVLHTHTRDPSHNPFLTLYDDMYRARHYGIQPDLLSSGNIIISSEGDLHLIDQWHNGIRPKNTALEFRMDHARLGGHLRMAALSLREELADPEVPQASKDAYLSRVGALSILMEQAHDTILARYANGKKPAMVFSEVGHIAGVALTDPPHKLLEALRTLNAQATGQAVA